MRYYRWVCSTCFVKSRFLVFCTVSVLSAFLSITMLFLSLVTQGCWCSAFSCYAIAIISEFFRYIALDQNILFPNYGCIWVNHFKNHKRISFLENKKSCVLYTDNIIFTCAFHVCMSIVQFCIVVTNRINKKKA